MNQKIVDYEIKDAKEEQSSLQKIITFVKKNPIFVLIVTGLIAIISYDFVYKKLPQKKQQQIQQQEEEKEENKKGNNNEQKENIYILDEDLSEDEVRQKLTLAFNVLNDKYNLLSESLKKQDDLWEPFLQIKKYFVLENPKNKEGKWVLLESYDYENHSSILMYSIEDLSLKINNIFINKDKNNA